MQEGGISLNFEDEGSNVPLSCSGLLPAQSLSGGHSLMAGVGGPGGSQAQGLGGTACPPASP